MKRKRFWIGISTVLVAIALILVFGLSQKDTKEVSVVSSAPKTETVQKVDVKETKVEKVESKKKETKKEKPRKEIVEEKKVQSGEVKVETKKEETVKTTAPVQKTESKSVAPSTKVIQPETKYVNVSSLNMRSGVGTNHAVITSVTQGQAVTVTELSDSWSKVEVNDKTGWVSSKYLSGTKPKVVAPKSSTSPSSKPSAPATTPTPAPKSSAPQNDADKLRKVSGNRQLILVTANGSSTRNAAIQTFEKDGSGKWNRVMNVSGFIGKNGFGKSQEGDGKTPVGKYTIGTAFGQKGNPGTKLPFRAITSDDVWVDDSKSSLYNSWQSKSQTQGQWTSAENMTHRLYTYGFVINYNTQRTPYKGSAIFFHTGSSYTLGCVATSQSNVVSILKWLDPAKNPVIIMTPSQNLSSY